MGGELEYIQVYWKVLYSTCDYLPFFGFCLEQPEWLPFIVGNLPVLTTKK